MYKNIKGNSPSDCMSSQNNSCQINPITSLSGLPWKKPTEMKHHLFIPRGAPMVKNLPPNEGDTTDKGSIHGWGRSPGGGKWQPAPVFLPEEFHGQKSLVGYSPWGHRVGHDWATEHTHTIHPTADIHQTNTVPGGLQCGSLTHINILRLRSSNFTGKELAYKHSNTLPKSW